jgi:hypothetical protein
LLWDTLRKLFPFFLSKKPQKEAKTAWSCFAPAGATRAARPRPAQTFEKV